MAFHVFAVVISVEGDLDEAYKTLADKMGESGLNWKSTDEVCDHDANEVDMAELERVRSEYGRKKASR